MLKSHVVVPSRPQCHIVSYKCYNLFKDMVDNFVFLICSRIENSTIQNVDCHIQRSNVKSANCHLKLAFSATFLLCAFSNVRIVI